MCSQEFPIWPLAEPDDFSSRLHTISDLFSYYPLAIVLVFQMGLFSVSVLISPIPMVHNIKMYWICLVHWWCSLAILYDVLSRNIWCVPFRIIKGDSLARSFRFFFEREGKNLADVTSRWITHCVHSAFTTGDFIETWDSEHLTTKEGFHHCQPCTSLFIQCAVHKILTSF